LKKKINPRDNDPQSPIMAFEGNLLYFNKNNKNIIEIILYNK
jgi:hypothetical protein